MSETLTVTALEILHEGRALIADPRRWTQKDFARDRDDETVSEESPKAVCWCSLGAIHKVTWALPFDTFELQASVNGFLTMAIAQIDPLIDEPLGTGAKRHPGLVEFNDTRTHAEVLEVWDRAIRLAGGTPPTA